MRGGIKEVIIPKDNEKDLKEMPKNILKALKIHPVKFVDEVFAIGMKSKLPNKKNISKKPKIQVKKIKTIKEKELTH